MLALASEAYAEAVGYAQVGGGIDGDMLVLDEGDDERIWQDSCEGEDLREDVV